MAEQPKTKNPVAQAAFQTAKELRDYAYGPKCFTSDQSALLAVAKGWESFGNALAKGVAPAD